MKFHLIFLTSIIFLFLSVFPSVLKTAKVLPVNMLNCVPYVLKCPTCLKSYFALPTLVHHVFRDLLALLPHMLRVLRAHCLTCFVLYVLSCLTYSQVSCTRKSKIKSKINIFDAIYDMIPFTQL